MLAQLGRQRIRLFKIKKKKNKRCKLVVCVCECVFNHSVDRKQRLKLCSPLVSARKASGYRNGEKWTLIRSVSLTYRLWQHGQTRLNLLSFNQFHHDGCEPERTRRETTARRFNNRALVVLNKLRNWIPSELVSSGLYLLDTTDYLHHRCLASFTACFFGSWNGQKTEDFNCSTGCQD